MTAPLCPDCGCTARESPLGYICDTCHAHVPTAPTQARGGGRRENGSTPPVEPSAVIVTLADVARQEISWIWTPGRIPKGRLVMIDGDPGVGKSWATLAIATAITTGQPLPGETEGRDPAKVLLLTAEDGLADTVRPRLEDMGADLTRVRVLTAVQDEKGNQRHPSLVDDLAVLDEVLGEGGYALVVIDPINAYLGYTIDTHRDAALRAVLTPLALLAERWGVALLCVRHLTKGARDRAIYRGQGGIAFCAAARVVHLIGVNPDDPTERVMTVIKNNLAAIPPSLAFEIREGRFLWRGETSVSAAALLVRDADEGERGQREEAMSFLETLLTDGPMEVTQIEDECKAAGIRPATLRRAKEKLGVLSQRQGGLGAKGRWSWGLPPNMINPPDTQMMITLEEDRYGERERDDHLSTLQEIDPANMLTCSHTGEMSTLGEPIKERGSLVALAVSLGAKEVDDG